MTHDEVTRCYANMLLQLVPASSDANVQENPAHFICVQFRQCEEA